jgi:hypothetical protein
MKISNKLTSFILFLLCITSINLKAQTYCNVSGYLVNTYEYITNVSFLSINNSSGANANAYGNYTSLTPPTIVAGSTYSISVTIYPDWDEYIYVYFDWNQNGSLSDPGETYLIASAVSNAGPHLFNISVPSTALPGNTRMRVVLDYYDYSMGDPCVYNGYYGEVEDYTVNVQQPISITSLVVGTQGNVPAVININGGTLQMTSTITPSNANQSVTWSIVDGTGLASISSTGLITPISNGTVWAKAVSVADATKKDSMLVTISNQIIPITNLSVSTQGGVPPIIDVYQATLQLVSTISPSYADQNVTWSIIPINGSASISSSGLVSPLSNGLVWAKATSVSDPNKKDSIQITISNQYEPAQSISVNTLGNVPPVITTNGGSLTMLATVLPAAATQDVYWSLIPVTGNAVINNYGIITALNNGTVWAKAVSVDNTTLKDSMLITISNQIVVISSLNISTQGNVLPNINTYQGNLQMVSQILPSYADQGVIWSITPVTGNATISTTGLITAISDGTVWVKAVSIADPSKKDSMQVFISNQTLPITQIEVRTQNNAPPFITTHAGTLQLEAVISPNNANPTVNWVITNETGSATISSTGLVTALTNGTVWAKATSVQNLAMKDSIQITITGQTVPISRLRVNTENGIPAQVNLNGTLQMITSILPYEANQDVTWSIVKKTGDASINQNGLITPINSGIIYAKAVSVEQPHMMDSMRILVIASYTDINQHEMQELEIYPNPVSNELNIIFDAQHLNNTIATIYNALGQIMYNEKIESTHTLINTSRYSSGIYVLEIKDKENRIQKYKIVKP